MRQPYYEILTGASVACALALGSYKIVTSVFGKPKPEKSAEDLL